MAISLLLFSDNLAKSHGEVIIKHSQSMPHVLSSKEIHQQFDEDEDPNDAHVSPTALNEVRSETASNDGSDADYKDESYTTQIEEVPSFDKFEETLVYRIAGQITFVNAAAQFERVILFTKRITGLKVVVISLRYLYYCDMDGVDGLCEIVETLKRQGLQVYITGLNNAIEPLFSKTKVFKELESSGHIMSHYFDALRHAAEKKEVEKIKKSENSEKSEPVEP